MRVSSIKFKPNIGKHLKIHYKSNELNDLISKLNIKKRSFDQNKLQKYILPKVTIENLKKHNVNFSYKSNRFYKYIMNKRSSFTDENNSKMNNIIFSANNSIKTEARSCLSIILHVEKVKIAAAIHLAAGSETENIYNEEMFMFGYSNIKKLSFDYPITAYITGKTVYSRYDNNDSKEMQDYTKEVTLTLFNKLLPLFQHSGIKPVFIDIGAIYRSQKLLIKTGEYILQ